MTIQLPLIANEIDYENITTTGELKEEYYYNLTTLGELLGIKNGIYLKARRKGLVLIKYMGKNHISGKDLLSIMLS